MNKVSIYKVDSSIFKMEHQNQKCKKKAHFQKCRPPTFTRTLLRTLSTPTPCSIDAYSVLHRRILRTLSESIFFFFLNSFTLIIRVYRRVLHTLSTHTPYSIASTPTPYSSTVVNGLSIPIKMASPTKKQKTKKSFISSQCFVCWSCHCHYLLRKQF